MKKYKDILSDAGIKPTIQRIKILEYLDHHHDHPTVDMIYAKLFRQVPTLSKTTVYNTLDLFREHGIINVLYITESELRFELRHTTHYHFYCRICGSISDVEVGCEYLEGMMIEGHKIEEIHCFFRGVCRSCQTKTNKNEAN